MGLPWEWVNGQNPSLFDGCLGRVKLGVGRVRRLVGRDGGQGVHWESALDKGVNQSIPRGLGTLSQ